MDWPFEVTEEGTTDGFQFAGRTGVDSSTGRRGWGGDNREFGTYFI